MNCIRIISGDSPINYRCISHENAVVHSRIRGIDDRPKNKVRRDNLLVGWTGARFRYNLKSINPTYLNCNDSFYSID